MVEMCSCCQSHTPGNLFLSTLLPNGEISRTRHRICTWPGYSLNYSTILLLQSTHKRGITLLSCSSKTLLLKAKSAASPPGTFPSPLKINETHCRLLNNNNLKSHKNGLTCNLDGELTSCRENNSQHPAWRAKRWECIVKAAGASFSPKNEIREIQNFWKSSEESFGSVVLILCIVCTEIQVKNTVSVFCEWQLRDSTAKVCDHFPSCLYRESSRGWTQLNLWMLCLQLLKFSRS